MKFKQFLLTPQCLFCGSFFVTENLFCEACKDKLESTLYLKSEIKEHIYLYDWSVDSLQYVDQLVYRLKSNLSEIALDFYAKKLAKRLKESINLKLYSGVVPIPSARFKNDHGKFLAQVISHELGLKYFDFLSKKESQLTQKKLNKIDRQVNEQFSLISHSHVQFTEPTQDVSKNIPSYILVDDVLTTGQSYFKCSELLFWSKQNAIATLFYRTKR